MTPVTSKTLRTSLRQAYKVCVAPEALALTNVQGMAHILSFNAKIRRSILTGDKPVFVDMSQCRKVDMIGAILVGAEIHRCNEIRPDRIGGCLPSDNQARAMLADIGFYRAIGLDHPDGLYQPPGIIKIRSGQGGSAEIPQLLGDVAEMATTIWKDQGFADRVHGALNEAITNVLMHAYEPVLLANAVPTKPGRWWVGGFSKPNSGRAFFVALDHGVGIPASAPYKNRDLKAYLAKAKVARDDDILWHVVTQEGRSRTGLPQHGKGIPSMVDLVRERTRSGAIWIQSGGAGYVLGKDPKRPPNGQIIETKYPLPVKMPGTLIVWKVDLPVPTVLPGLTA